MNNKFALTSIVLMEEWLGHPKNSKININGFKAEEMVSRKIARYNSEIEENDIQGKEEIKVDEEKPTVKKMGRPPKDKMMRNYKNK